MITHNGGIYWLCCDRCFTSVIPAETYQDAINIKKEQGWMSERQQDGKWIDICNFCLRDGNVQNEER